MAFRTWNSCPGLETLARAEFATLDEAKAYRTPEGAPNRITADDGREWTRAGYPDRSPEWFQTAEADGLLPPFPAGLTRVEHLNRLAAERREALRALGAKGPSAAAQAAIRDASPRARGLYPRKG